MKDLLEKIISYLPIYIPDLVRIVSGPKRFVAQRNKGAEGDLIKAFTFLGISMSIFFILQAPLAVTGKEFVTDTASHGILYLLFVVVLSAILCASWRIVGGKAGYQQLLITASYYAGAMSIGLAIASLCFVGVLRMLYPESHALLLRFAATGNLREVFDAEPSILKGFLVASFVFLTVTVPTLVWGFIGWGAYRELNQLRRSHSGAALFLTIIFSLPLIAIEMILALAM
jgi:hypothetical protein